MVVLLVAPRILLTLFDQRLLLLQPEYVEYVRAVPKEDVPVVKSDFHRKVVVDRLFTHSAFRTDFPRFGKRAPRGEIAVHRHHERLNKRLSNRRSRLGSHKRPCENTRA